MLVEKVYSAQYVSGEDSDYDAYQATIADKRVRAQSFTIPAPGALPNDLSGFLATSSGSGLVRDSIMPITAILLSDDDIKKKITLENMARREKLDRTIRLPKTFADMLGEKDIAVYIHNGEGELDGKTIAYDKKGLRVVHVIR